MTDNRYGDPEGLVERLRKWRARLTSDKSLPWIGMGLIADFDTAIDMLENWCPPDVRAPAIVVSDLLS